jgi:phospholipid-transporting ATPase
VRGNEAACVADYAIAEFRAISRLLFVHGAWNATRMAIMTHYFFYKNICFYLTQLWFVLYTKWSGQVLFETSTITLYNLIFTSVPPIVLCLCGGKTPSSHIHYRHGSHFSAWTVFLWVLPAVYHSAIAFFLTRHVYVVGDAQDESDQGGGKLQILAHASQLNLRNTVKQI